ncbi:DUF2254 domain-containing protein [Microbacterium sp. C7(2022)]|uniref:DUF2254 domain-containing protein n=1 Tax=Microbacterium sp. C7(2022) TaxID=2992759 RepID=UPI00237AF942|nr:DUF2254 domain-containing protein [Microbacterium sp. C7(2022)]MDE0546485.1 DUF2254 domain-containing protein [Microbacterium sp. C7(2022)]
MFLARLARQVWFRAAIFTVVAVAYALLIGWIGPLIPISPELDLGQGAVDNLLQILATSMLAVTTFSLTAMVTAYSSAATIATPRATQLLVQDTTSQNVLSTFVGGFTFSLVGIIALSTGYYPDEARTLLFLGTLVIIVIIVVTLLGWIAHLSNFGRMADIINRVESAASDTLTAYACRPSLGARVQYTIPTTATPVFADTPGYITHIDVRALDRIASQASLQVFVVATPGRVADARMPLVRVTGAPDESTTASLRAAFHVEQHRTYEQDPRLGVIALSEIASRALSPAVNDPGTAIDVLGAVQRVFTAMLRQERDDEITYPRVWIAPVRLGDLVEDAFRPISRDGSGMLEVALRVQKVLAGLAASSPGNARVFRTAATQSARRAMTSLAADDARILRRAHRELWR